MVSAATGELLAQDCDLASLAGLSMRVHHAHLAPGHRASAPHWHSHSEELVMVLEGSLRLHQGDATRLLEAGEMALFPAATPEAHWLSNPGPELASFLSIATGHPEDQVQYAPSPIDTLS